MASRPPQSGNENLKRQHCVKNQASSQISQMIGASWHRSRTLSLAVISAPASSRRRTQSVWPPCAARSSAVYPSCVCVCVSGGTCNGCFSNKIIQLVTDRENRENLHSQKLQRILSAKQFSGNIHCSRPPCRRLSPTAGRHTRCNLPRRHESAPCLRPASRKACAQIV
jgi:hypothetical protein